MATTKVKLTKESLTYSSAKQRELMRVIFEAYEQFASRKQHYYPLMGMSTSHISQHAVQDFTTLHAFWPPELVESTLRYGNVYRLEPDTLSKVQTAVRAELDKLATKGYIEKVGNEHERRWRPVKDLMVKF